MPTPIAHGKAWKVGDNVPTDSIVPEIMVFKTFDEMARETLKTVHPTFADQVQPGDVLVAGKNFGCSSGRAVAVKAIIATRISVVVADSFSRTFYRNAFEIGLAIMEVPGITDKVTEGDLLAVDVEAGTVVNETTGERLTGLPVPPLLLEMRAAGGIIPFADRLAAR